MVVFTPGELVARLVGSGARPVHARGEVYARLDMDIQGGDGSKTEQVFVRLRPDWAPRGVKRFLQMVELGDLEDSAIYHVDKSDRVEFGFPAEPTLPLAPIKDDNVKASNTRGTVSFARTSYSGRVNELFINCKDNSHLDLTGISPIGEVVEGGMDVVDRLYDGYGKRPDKYELQTSGNAYVEAEFPKIPKIKKVKVMGVSS